MMQSSRKCMRSKSTIRACRDKRGDRHYDKVGGISGSYLHPKTDEKKAAYMSKQEMTYVQHLHTLNSKLYEGRLARTDQCSNQEGPNETYLCDHKMDENSCSAKNDSNLDVGE